MMKYTTLIRAMAILLTLAATTHADGPFTIGAYTIDGGGGVSVGGAFELEATIGQPDAGYVFGGDFELTGGFWSATVTTCACPGDTNADGELNGNDIAQFVSCFVGDSNCSCADVDGVTGLTFADLDAFVIELLADSTCP